MADGATELDMVINIGQAKGGEWDAVTADIAAVTKVAHDGGAIVKVIFENCFLNDEQKMRLCRICGEVGADYVKTSTGYGTGGATHGRPAPDAAVVAASRQAEGGRRHSHARCDDRSRRSRLRPHRRLANGRDPRRAQNPARGWSVSRGTAVSGCAACRQRPRFACRRFDRSGPVGVPTIKVSHRPMKSPVSSTPAMHCSSRSSDSGIVDGARTGNR